MQKNSEYKNQKTLQTEGQVDSLYENAKKKTSNITREKGEFFFFKFKEKKY